MADQPFERIRLGTIQAAIWRNQDREGNVRFNTTIERIYLDDKNDWQSTNSFGRDELLLVAKVADLANTKVFEMIQTERRYHDSQRPPNGRGSASAPSTPPSGTPPKTGGAAASTKAKQLAGQER